MNYYEVLGVPETASYEQIRAAYLTLVKKYHPDRYQNNPLKDLATEKLKLINEAYDALTAKHSAGKSTSSNMHSGGYSGFSGSSSYSGQYAMEFARVRSMLSSQRLYEAAALLDAIPLKNAEWYYLYGIIYFREGQYSSAYDYLSRATSMDPSNDEYRKAFSMVQQHGSRGYRSSRDSSSSICSICSALLCADCCCECMGGDLIPCC